MEWIGRDVLIQARVVGGCAQPILMSYGQLVGRYMDTLILAIKCWNSKIVAFTFNEAEIVAISLRHTKFLYIKTINRLPTTTVLLELFRS